MKLTDTRCASFPSSRFLSTQKYYLVMLPFQKDLQANVKVVCFFLIDFFLPFPPLPDPYRPECSDERRP